VSEFFCLVKLIRPLYDVTFFVLVLMIVLLYVRPSRVVNSFFRACDVSPLSSSFSSFPAVTIISRLLFFSSLDWEGQVPPLL